ncbi:MAG TPA: Hsp33 family molecular chaperone HslO [Gammaproteobacteria bacterium]|nr:Hsp33 family molecular chaperone HslO [Gammaproteobacteria bacterium]
MNDNDVLRRFLFEAAPVRGVSVRLDATWRAVLMRHDYPPAIRQLLGELMAAVALLSATLKFEGRLVAQLQGHGPVTLLVVEATSQRTLRAIAHWNEEPKRYDLAAMLGDGRLVITVEPEGGGERYQGIVELAGDTVAETMSNYLMQSEQLGTHVWLAADDQQAAGLLIQKLPSDATAEDADLYNRVVHLAETITVPELLELPARDLLRRLFHEEDVRLFETEPVCFRCTCNRDRVASMLRALGSEEVHSILLEQDRVEVACEFCNQKYRFDAVDVEQLFATDMSPGTPGTFH